MKKSLSIFANVLAWIVLIFALLITIMVFSSSKNNGVAHLFGYMPMAVESDSMKPTFKTGDLIICKEIDDYSSIKENDVITFWTTIQGQRVKNTHRIVEIIDQDGVVKYVTKGDNNPVNDEDVISQGAIIGRWTDVKLPLVGKLMDFLRTKTGFFICIVIPMAIFFLFELYKFIATIIEAKRPEPVEVDEEEIKKRAIEEYLASQKQAEAAEKAAEAVHEKAAEKVTEAAEKAAETAEKANEKAAVTAEEITEKVTDLAESAKKTVAEATGNDSELSKAMENATKELLDTLEDNISENVSAAAETAEDVIEAAGDAAKTE